MLRILFVCHGNICRSTMAQYLFEYLAKERGYRAAESESDYGDFYVDSAATSREEIGNPVDRRTVSKLKEHGVLCGNHRARQVTGHDYAVFDLLIIMDQENLRGIRRILPDDPENKIHLMLEYAREPEFRDRNRAPRDVSDPWYTHDFERTYKDLYAGCSGLLDYLAD